MMTQPSLFEFPKAQEPAALIVFRRQARMDAQFERVFEVKMDDYYAGDLLGFDVVRFDDEVLRSGQQSVSEALLRRGFQALRRGVQLTEYWPHVVAYLWYLCSGDKTRVVQVAEDYSARWERLKDGVS